MLCVRVIIRSASYCQKGPDPTLTLVSLFLYDDLQIFL